MPHDVSAGKSEYATLSLGCGERRCQSQTAPYPDKRTYVGLVEAGLKRAL